LLISETIALDEKSSITLCIPHPILLLYKIKQVPMEHFYTDRMIVIPVAYPKHRSGNGGTPVIFYGHTTMKIISFIEETKIIDKILRHCELWKVPVMHPSSVKNTGTPKKVNGTTLDSCPV
jgi:hypothetical protein